MQKFYLTETDPHLLAKKYARQGSSVWRMKVGSNWVFKCLLKKCPKCSSRLQGALSDNGWERCIKRGCDYSRQVFTASELKVFIR